MNQLNTEEEKKAYEEYVKSVTPKHSLPKNMLKAFLVGGIICVIGQVILNWCQNMGMDEKTAGSWCSIVLVFLSALLTGLNIYPRLAKFGGAGTLVPITGFANSVAAPALEYQKDESDIIGLSQKDLIDKGRVWRFSLT